MLGFTISHLQHGGRFRFVIIQAKTAHLEIVTCGKQSLEIQFP